MAAILSSCYSLVESVYTEKRASERLTHKVLAIAKSYPSCLCETAILPAVTMTGFLALTLAFPRISGNQVDVKAKSGSSRDKSKGGMQEVDLGICGAAGLAMGVLVLGWFGAFVSGFMSQDFGSLS